MESQMKGQRQGTLWIGHQPGHTETTKHVCGLWEEARVLGEHANSARFKTTLGLKQGPSGSEVRVLTTNK